ncbi:hypothetical protein AN478_11885 [Thiohalorhabdus denitrificans]|nr:hypothetical protein AN478_11885 [Thiohalorhabdus denitrificans]
MAGVLALSGCGDEADNKTVTEYMNGTSDPVNYNDPSTVDRPTGVDSYAESASVIPDTDFAAKSGSPSLQSPADIAQESDADYSNNTNGLITAGTLEAWMNDWPAGNKPSGFSGDLVILEVADGGNYDDDGNWTGGGTYFQQNTGNGDGNNVRTYVVSHMDVRENRNNGVMDSVAMVPSESGINNFMAKYNIDPTSDMVVVAMGKGGGFANMQMGRVWYALRYWGAPAENLAMLNGGAQYHASQGDLSSVQENTDPSTVVTGHYNPSIADGSVATAPTPAADLPEANMDLMISYEGLLKMVAESEGVPSGGYLLWDARSAEEYYGLENQGRGYAFEGHVRTAENLPYGELLVADEGYRYLSKPALQSKLDGLGYEDGQTVITYCVTTYRAMITGIASGVVLGKPTRFYDGAWMQWGKMAYHQNKEGTYNLASDSPWRADIPEASRWINYDPDADDSGGSSGGDDGDVAVPEQGCG